MCTLMLFFDCADAELERLLPAAKSLEHLDLSDCRVSNSACHLLASNAPNLQWLR